MLHHSRGAARAALIEMTDSIGQGMVPNNLVPTMARLRQENVQMITGARVKKIDDRTAAYAAFSTFILEERPNTEQLHFIEQVVDYVVENGYINNVLDLMKTPFDRPYKFSLIFTYEEQVKFVKIINNIKNNALVT